LLASARVFDRLADGKAKTFALVSAGLVSQGNRDVGHLAIRRAHLVQLCYLRALPKDGLKLAGCRDERCVKVRVGHERLTGAVRGVSIEGTHGEHIVLRDPKHQSDSSLGARWHSRRDEATPIGCAVGVHRTVGYLNVEGVCSHGQNALVAPAVRMSH
jgi:hypothetical protein